MVYLGFLGSGFNGTVQVRLIVERLGVPTVARIVFVESSIVEKTIATNLQLLAGDLVYVTAQNTGTTPLSTIGSINNPPIGESKTWFSMALVAQQ
jgi:hypothetical protein